MKQGLTDITIVLDRSGSMSAVRQDTIGGFNTFLTDQKAVPGDVVFSLAQFDDRYEVVHDAIPLASVPELTNYTFIPRGSTALLDAIGRTVVSMGERFVRTPEFERPEKVLLVIMTDGCENASKEYTREQVFKMLTEQRESYSWQIAFVGANQDAVATGVSMGIAPSNALNYAGTGDGTRSAMLGVTQATLQYRNSPGAETKDFFGKSPR